MAKEKNQDGQLEMFSLFDMEAVKTGARTNKLSASVKINNDSETLSPEEELQQNTLHIRKVYENFDFASVVIKEHEFESCVFEGCHFVKADLTAVMFQDCQFNNCDFVIPKLLNSAIQNCSFNGCKLMGVDFSSCSNLDFSPEFKDSLITDCNFEGNKMSKTTFYDSDIKDTIFSYCDLTESGFDRCEFEKSHFYDCDLSRSDFTDALGYSIDPFKNKLKGARFTLPEAQSFLSYLEIEVE